MDDPRDFFEGCLNGVLIEAIAVILACILFTLLA